MTRPSVISLRDGRTLAYAEWGDPSGLPVLHCHGIPGSRLEVHRGHDFYRGLGTRYITADRPGYGLSDPSPGRGFTDWPADAEQLLDGLGVERFHLIGISGGAPFALAIAHAMPSRVARVAIVSGVGPADRPGALAGIDFTERFNYWASPRHPRLAGAATAAIFGGLARTGEIFSWAAARGGRRIATHAEGARAMAEQFREALRQGPRATVDENAMCARPWGFRPEDVLPEVRLWHGDRDRVCPLHHAEHLATALPNASLTVLPGGHMLVMRCIEDTLRDLIA